MVKIQSCRVPEVRQTHGVGSSAEFDAGVADNGFKLDNDDVILFLGRHVQTDGGFEAVPGCRGPRNVVNDTFIAVLGWGRGAKDQLQKEKRNGDRELHVPNLAQKSLCPNPGWEQLFQRKTRKGRSDLLRPEFVMLSKRDFASRAFLIGFAHFHLPYLLPCVVRRRQGSFFC